MEFKTLKSSIEKANETIKTNWGKASKDPYRPMYHPIAPHGWMNDPNGLIFNDGWYHVFYQWNPYGSNWGNMHWGHMRTTDFASWEHISTALAPECPYEKDGCFSGSAVMDGNAMVLVYTANVFESGKHPFNEGPLAVQVQALAKSSNGTLFTKQPQNPVIKDVPESATQVDFRDPKVWKEGEQWVMVLGSRNGNQGEILKYTSKDLVHWAFDSTVVAPTNLGYMLECPDSFEVNGKEVLMFCPMGISGYHSANVSGYLIKMGEYDAYQFKLTDYGPHFYAPQTFEDGAGNRIMIGWIPMPGLDSLNRSWSGCLTLPRKLAVSRGNHLLSVPYQGMKLRMVAEKEMNQTVLSGGESITFEGDHHCISLKMKAAKSHEVRIQIKGNEEGTAYTEVVIDSVSKRVILDWSKSGTSLNSNEAMQRTVYDFAHLRNLQMMDFDIFIDKSVIEVYGLGGHVTMTAAVLSEPQNVKGRILCRNQSVHIEQLSIYKIEAVRHRLCLEE